MLSLIYHLRWCLDELSDFVSVVVVVWAMADNAPLAAINKKRILFIYDIFSVENLMLIINF